MRITVWKCARCFRIKPRKDFGEISLKAICRTCQAELTGFNGNTPNTPHEAHILARRVFKTPTGPCRDKE